MAKYLLDPCPNCDTPMHFPAMPSIEFVIERLMADSGGKCPICGEQVVVDELPPKKQPLDPLGAAHATEGICQLNINDLPLSVRCRAAIVQTKAVTVGDLLERGRDGVLEDLGENSACAQDLCRLFCEIQHRLVALSANFDSPRGLLRESHSLFIQRVSPR